MVCTNKHYTQSTLQTTVILNHRYNLLTKNIPDVPQLQVSLEKVILPRNQHANLKAML